MKLNKLAFGYAWGIVSGFGIFLVMAYSLIGDKATDFMARIAVLHFVTYSWSGAFVMLIEHLVAGFVVGWVFAWLYNELLKE